MQRAQVIRLELYLMRLWELKAAGKATATSDELAAVVGVSGSRVRQDMMSLRIIGKPRSGYGVNMLAERICDALDLYDQKGMVLVGCGNLGRALINSGIWETAGFTLRAVFDSNESLVGTKIGRFTVQHVSELHKSIKRRRITAACIAVPAHAAQAVADTVVAAGVQGIWNFAPTDVRVPPGTILENQHLEHGLMTLSYMLKRRRSAAASANLVEPSEDAATDDSSLEAGPAEQVPEEYSGNVTVEAAAVAE